MAWKCLAMVAFGVAVGDGPWVCTDDKVTDKKQKEKTCMFDGETVQLGECRKHAGVKCGIFDFTDCGPRQDCVDDPGSYLGGKHCTCKEPNECADGYGGCFDIGEKLDFAPIWVCTEEHSHLHKHKIDDASCYAGICYGYRQATCGNPDGHDCWCEKNTCQFKGECVGLGQCRKHLPSGLSGCSVSGCGARQKCVHTPGYLFSGKQCVCTEEDECATDLGECIKMNDTTAHLGIANDASVDSPAFSLPLVIAIVGMAAVASGIATVRMLKARAVAQDEYVILLA